MRFAPNCCILLCLLHVGNLACAVTSAEEVSYEQLVYRYLKGELHLEERLRSSPAALPALERYLHPVETPEMPEVEPWIKLLGDAQFSVREHATKQLVNTLPDSRSTLVKALEAAEDTEVRWRLKRLLSLSQGTKETHAAVRRILQLMYRKHLPEIWQDYFALFKEDPHHYRALLLFQHTRIEDMLRQTNGELSSQQKLHYLLALKYLGYDWNQLTSLLHKFTGQEILTAAAATYWPVELQPLKKDGTYHWTARCESLENKQARHVLLMCIDQNKYTSINSKPFELDDEVGKTRPPGNMVHFDTWQRWDYLFRFKTPYVQTYDGVALTQRHNGQLRPKVLQTIPDGMELPTAHVERKEQQGWSLGKQYAWARKFYPADLVSGIEFRSNDGTETKTLIPAVGTANTDPAKE